MSVDEPSEALRRTLRDMVALSVLPAVWGQFEPRQLAASLAKVVRDTLMVPVVYVRLEPQASGEIAEVASTHRPCSPEEIDAIGHAFAPVVEQTAADGPITLPNPIGAGMLRCARVPIAWRGGQWTLIAGGVEPTFPTLEERMLLGAAANHAAVALERATTFRSLRESERRAESANRDKDEFLANVSHEIRTPMNAILGLTELTLDTPLTDQQRGWLSAVKSAGDHLLVIIDSLLDFSKVGASKIELDLTEFSLRGQLARLVGGLISHAYKKGLELVLDVHDDVPDVVIGDAGRLRQILINLLENAIKFTAAGEVVLTVSVGDAADLVAPDIELRFAVRDTGIGIAADQHDSIFEPFTQADSSTTRRFGGTGLGLTIAAKLAALMQGDIDVKSEIDLGSVFTLRARVRRIDRGSGVALTSRWPGVRALVVNENVTAGEVLQRWLADWGVAADIVRDGGSATDALLRAAGPREYRLVLIDGNAPGVVADPATRAQPSFVERGVLRIMRLGAQAEAAELTESRVRKPLIKEELRLAIQGLLEPTRSDVLAEVVTPAVGNVAAASPLRVLVGEDNEFNAMLIGELLRRKGHHPHVVPDGVGVLAELEARSYDLLLLDLHMPGLDGFQVIREIRAREEVSGGRLSVIALTARSRDQDRERCFAAGMDGFVPKPINSAALWAAVAGIPVPMLVPHDA